MRKEVASGSSPLLVRVGFGQTHPAWGSVHQNAQDVIHEAERHVQAIGEPIDVLVLPELALAGYAFENLSSLLDHSETPSDGPTRELASRLSEMIGGAVVVGFAERASTHASGEVPIVYNSAMIVGGDLLLGVYQKTHLFYKEKKVFTPGRTGFFTTDLVSSSGVSFKLGTMICFDWYFPESARTLASIGADVIAHPSNLVTPWSPIAMPIRALENRVHAVTANRIGTEQLAGETLTFIGQSGVYRANGYTAVRAPEHEVVFDSCLLDIAESRNKQFTSENHLWDDLRKESYRLG